MSLSDEQKEIHFKNDLKATNNMFDFLEVVKKYYDLKNAKPGTIAKITLVNNIDKIIKLSNAKLK